MSGKTVCVVGAGVSGISALKECLINGLQPTCFEIHAKPGGIWHMKPEGESSNTPAVWGTMITNTSKYNTSFSDFPADPKDSPYQQWDKVEEYLNKAIDFYGVRKHIQLNTRVIKIRKSPDYGTTGRWEVYTCGSNEGVAGEAFPGPRGGNEEDLKRCTRHVFDNVIICSGYFKVPKYPDIPLKTFNGSISHANEFSNPEAFRGKKVLVVGKHYSAGDVVTEVSNVAEEAYLAVREGTWIIPRSFNGRWPIDNGISRAILYHKDAEILFNDWLIDLAGRNLDHKECGISPGTPPTVSGFALNDVLPVKIQAGQIKVYGDLTELRGNDAHFRDGKVISGLDAVIFCTGYRPELSFLDMKIIQDNYKIEMYKMTFPLNQPHNTLAIVGLFASTLPLWGVYESQSRMAAMVMSGRHQLPTQKKMKEDADFWNTLQMTVNTHFSYLLPSFVVQDNIGETCGFYPSFWKIFFRDPVLALKIWYGPWMNVHARLLGPGSDWEKARSTIYSYHDTGLKPVRRLEQKELVRTDKKKRSEFRMKLLFLGSVLVGVVAMFFRFGQFGSLQLEKS